MKKILLLLLVSFVFLSGCFQSIALLGPAIGGASTGKIYQAGLSYGTNACNVASYRKNNN